MAHNQHMINQLSIVYVATVKLVSVHISSIDYYHVCSSRCITHASQLNATMNDFVDHGVHMKKIYQQKLYWT